MTRRQKDPLRPLSEEEREWLEKIAHGRSQPACQVIRARQVLAVAEGKSYTAAAHDTGRRSGDAVAELIAHFNQEGLAAMAAGQGSGIRRATASEF